MSKKCLIRSSRFQHFGILSLLVGSLAAAPGVDFNRDIRPILSDNCFACHGPDVAKQKAELRLDDRADAVAPAKSGAAAIVPGNPGQSELVRRIFTADEDDQMPPPESHKKLTIAQKTLLRTWIAEGAEYKGHWAFIPAATAPRAANLKS